MYSLTIHFGPNAVCWQFLFKDKERVSTYTQIFEKGVAFVDLSDDYGQSANIKMTTVHGWLLEDLDLVEEAQIQRSLVNARAQAKLNSRASQDPTLRAAQAMRGPAMIQPMGRG